MHETVIAKQIIEDAKKQGDVTKIVVEVGEVGHLPAHDMEHVLKDISPWPFEITEKEAKVKCKCGFTGRPNILEKGHDNTVWACPKCEELMPKVLEGDQIILKSVDVK